MTKSIFGFIAAVWIAVAPACQAHTLDEVVKMRGKYDERMKEIDADATAKQQKVLKKYKSTLIVVERKVKLKGDLDGLLIVRSEVERFDVQKDLSVTNAVPQPDELRSVQELYLKYLGAISLDRARDIKKLWQQYDAALATLEKKNTVQGKVETALAVRAERDRVEKSSVVMSAHTAVAELAPVKKEPESVNKSMSFTAPVIEGFSEIVSASVSGKYPTYRGVLTSAYWTKTGEGQYVEWKTAKVPNNYPSNEAVFVWAGSNSPSEEDFNLLLNGKDLLSFSSGQNRSKKWKSSFSSLAFAYKNNEGGNAGIFTLTVPVSIVAKGKKQILKIVPKTKKTSNAWVMVHDFKDMTTATKE